MSLQRLTALFCFLTLGLTASAQEPSTPAAAVSEKIAVYVIPIVDAISKPNLFVLRRGLKEAIANDVGMVLLDMDTPGGRVDVTLEMMEMLAKFDGSTATYINPDAISAGSLSPRPLKRFTLPPGVRWAPQQLFKVVVKKYPRLPV